MHWTRHHVPVYPRHLPTSCPRLPPTPPFYSGSPPPPQLSHRGDFNSTNERVAKQPPPRQTELKAIYTADQAHLLLTREQLNAKGHTKGEGGQHSPSSSFPQLTFGQRRAPFSSTRKRKEPLCSEGWKSQLFGGVGSLGSRSKEETAGRR